MKLISRQTNCANVMARLRDASEMILALAPKCRKRVALGGDHQTLSGTTKGREGFRDIRRNYRISQYVWSGKRRIHITRDTPTFMKLIPWRALCRSTVKIIRGCVSGEGVWLIARLSAARNVSEAPDAARAAWLTTPNAIRRNRNCLRRSRPIVWLSENHAREFVDNDRWKCLTPMARAHAAGHDHDITLRGIIDVPFKITGVKTYVTRFVRPAYDGGYAAGRLPSINAR